jgi:hypothetical protein
MIQKPLAIGPREIFPTDFV